MEKSFAQNTLTAKRSIGSASIVAGWQVITVGGKKRRGPE